MISAYLLRNMKPEVRIMLFRKLISAPTVKVELDYTATVFTGEMPLTLISIGYQFAGSNALLARRHSLSCQPFFYHTSNTQLM